MFDFLPKAFKVVRENAWNKGGYALIAAGIVSINGVLQYILPALGRRVGVDFSIPPTPAWLSILLIVFGAALLILGRLIPDHSSKQTAPHPHDVELLKLFRELIKPHINKFLMGHSFRNPTPFKRLEPLEILSDEWRGAHFEFEDQELNEALLLIRSRAGALNDLVGEKLFSDDRDTKIGSPLTDMDRMHGISAQTRKGIAEMNEAARGVANAINNFERVARKKIPI